MTELAAAFSARGYMFNSLPGAHTPTVDLILSIETAKTMPAFRKLDFDDQVSFYERLALPHAGLT